MTILFLNRDQVEQLITMPEVIEATEEAFRAKALGKVQMPPKSYILFEKFEGDFRVMPAYLEELGAAGVKIVNVHPRNPKEQKIPSVMATIFLLDPKTGVPLAIMDGTHITNMRTGASGAVAIKYLARKDSKILGLIGAGTQAHTQLEATLYVAKIKEVRVFDLNPEKSQLLAEKYAQRLKVTPVKSAEEAVKGADIVTTVTPAHQPVVKANWVAPGTHINAMGADAAGKQELETGLLKRSKVVIDEWEQSSHGGEINIAVSQGILTRKDIAGELGEAVNGRKIRTAESDITIFDSTGLAIQDIMSAWRVYEKARETGLGQRLNLL